MKRPLRSGRKAPCCGVEGFVQARRHVFLMRPTSMSLWQRGGAELENAGTLQAGDEARLTAAGGRWLTAGITEGAEVLIWETNATLELSS